MKKVSQFTVFKFTHQLLITLGTLAASTVFVFASTATAQSLNLTIGDVERIWTDLKFCQDQVLKDQELRNDIYQNDTDRLSALNASLWTYSRRHFGEADARKLHANALLAGAIVMTWGKGVGPFAKMPLNPKLEALAWCRTRFAEPPQR